MEQATLRKTIVNIAPRWAEEDLYPWHDILEDGDSSVVSSISTLESEVTILPLTNSLPRSPTSIIYKARLIRPTWSEFAIKCQDSCSLFKCICNCHRHGPLDRRRLSVSGLSVRSKKQYLKQFAGLSRGYPTGQCVSSLEPPPWNPWNDMDTGDLLIREHRSSIRTNTAVNLESFKMFLNSLLFTTIIKCLTVVILALLAAITYDAITILHRSLNQEAYPTSNAIITLTFTLALSILTIIYFCYTIILESKRPPERMHTSYSKPLIVIFSEIITSIVWAQVMSVTIFIYMGMFGCMSEGERQLILWKQTESQSQVIEKICHREGTVIGLEVSLVLLLIFNFYTHLAQNFRFIHDVSL